MAGNEIISQFPAINFLLHDNFLFPIISGVNTARVRDCSFQYPVLFFRHVYNQLNVSSQIQPRP
ncbi:MAG: hypothetical protein B2I17_04970 [Thermoplasmatales archaeon B_DKE]|nr:MAG: hypothetical protein B2I17_04970 [Thermoplasmatales archaeon B_DKE]